jgi:UDP-3-O-[3-hydroxymyristoyl] glucosamine N-acyltransferase
LRTYRLGEIVARLGGELIGDPGAEIRRMATLESAGPGDLSCLSHPRYRRQLRGTRASAVDRWIKIPQTGRVVIGDDVEIGANTTIDRGALDDTVIEDGVKLDNQIQIGHNVRVVAHTAMAGCVAVAGSTRIGRHCAIGGAARIFGHLEIADRATISAAAVVTKSIARAGVYTGVLPSAPSREWARTVAHLRSLDRLVKRVRELEKRLSEPRKKKR